MKDKQELRKWLTAAQNITVIPFKAQQDEIVWTNMPVAETEWNPSMRLTLDMRNVTYARLVVRIGTVAPAIDAYFAIHAYYGGAWEELCWVYTSANINTTEVGAWNELISAAQGDFELRFIGGVGDGVIDPAIGNIYLQLR